MERRLGRTEERFLETARKSAAFPTAENRKKAQKAFDALPDYSPYKKAQFNGKKKSWL